MNEVLMIHGTRPEKILRNVLANNTPVFISYQLDGKWHISRILLNNLSDETFTVRISPQKKGSEIQLEVNQVVGISFQHGYGGGYDKFVFDTVVEDIEFLENNGLVGSISLSIPEQIEVVPQRSYARVCPPADLDVQVLFWHRYSISDDGEFTIAAGPDLEGTLIDLSAGGIQIGIEAAQSKNFKNGDCVGLRFSPLPHETPLMCNAQAMRVVARANGSSFSLGLKLIGLEASPEGRMVLQRICNIVDQYQQMNQPD